MNRFMSVLVAVSLAGCAYVGDGKYARDIQDNDQDQSISVRFGGDDCRDDDPTVTTCDYDGDGHLDVELGGDDCNDRRGDAFPGAPETCDGLDNDCDGLIDDADTDRVDAATYFVDADGDGFGNQDRPILACAAASGVVLDGTDCDDADAEVFPTAHESCDAKDRDCDGDPTGSATDPLVFYVDGDRDGFGTDVEVSRGCTGADGTAARAFTDPVDCDDGAASVYPGAAEVWYDGVDEDCAGGDDFDADLDGYRTTDGGRGPDCDDADAAISPAAVESCNEGVDDDCDGLADDSDPSVSSNGQWTYLPDLDRDGFGDDTNAAGYCPNHAPSGFVLVGGDCDDQRSNVSPADTEVCDLLDNDCNGAVDDGAIGRTTFFVDADADGHGGAPILACRLDVGLVATSDDCNDADGTVHPGAIEVCGDDVRQDCQAISPYDCDADGHEATADGGDDCDDGELSVHSGALEVCDGLDNDCDALLDDADDSLDLSTYADWYLDADGDGHGSSVLVAADTCYPGSGAATNHDDCDDSSATAHPGAGELCNGEDDDCDGDTDEDPQVALVYHLDRDLDGYGDPGATSAEGCVAPADGNAWVLDARDCDDTDLGANPLGVEVCDGDDEDCDGLVDDLDPSVQAISWFRDADGDGYGVSSATVAACAPPSGYVGASGDCNDNNTVANPGADEVCDSGIDNDCDGMPDDTDPDLAGQTQWFPDVDGDGHGAGTAISACAQPVGHVARNDDCDDADAHDNPTAYEVCDGTDNDCDGLADGADPDAVGPIWYEDLDGDGWGGVRFQACSGADATWVQTPGDAACDLDPVRAPGNPELCDGIDNDCDGKTDAADPGLVATREFWADGDNDGYGDPADAVRACTAPSGYVDAGLEDCAPGNTDVNAPSTWYVDVDHDGYGNDPVQACTQPVDTALVTGDCDDLDGERYPGNFEDCDGTDDDCNGVIDDSYLIYPDEDGDGWGSGGGSFGCGGSGYATSAGDCDDHDDLRYPTALEDCDGVDQDCDSLDDAVDGDTLRGPAYYDADGDGFGAGAQQPLCDFGHMSATADDCDDSDPSTFPGAVEVCNSDHDDDCDGDADDLDPNGAIGQQSYYLDADGDGFGGATTILACVAGSGGILSNTDCNDLDADVYPGQVFAVGPSRPDYSIEAAIAAGACDGAEIVVDPGTYPPFVIDGSVGHSAPNVTIRARYPSAPPVFYSTGAGSYAVVVDEAGSDVTIEDIEIDGRGVGPGIAVGGDSARLSSVYVHDTNGAGASDTGLDVRAGIWLTSAEAVCVDCVVEDHLYGYFDGFAIDPDGGDMTFYGGRVERTSVAFGSASLRATRLTIVGTELRDLDDGVVVIYPEAPVRLIDVDAENLTHLVAYSGADDARGPLSLEGVHARNVGHGLYAVSGGVPTTITDSELIGVHVGVENLGATSVILSDSVLIGDGFGAVGISAADTQLYNSTLGGFQTSISTGDLYGSASVVAGPVGTTNGSFDEMVFEQTPTGTLSGTYVANGTIAFARTKTRDSAAWDPALICPTTGLVFCPSFATDPGQYDSIPGHLATPEGYLYYLDADGDSLYDGWERRAFGSTSKGAFTDSDLDGSDNQTELAEGSDPNDPDSDGDGYLDGPDPQPLQPN